MGIPAWQSAMFFFLVFSVGIALFPSDREMGMRYSLSRASEQATQYLSRHFDKSPFDYANTLRYVENLSEAGMIQQSIDILEILAKEDRKDPQVYRILTKLYTDYLDEAKASVYAEKLLSLKIPEEERADLTEKLINYYSIANQKPELKKILYSEWIRTDKLSRLHEAAQVAVSTGEYAEAAEWYAKILERNPSDIEAMSWLAEYSEIEGKIEDAIRYYRNLAERPEADDYLRIKYVNLLHEKGEHQTIIDYLKNSASLFKEQLSRLMYLADALTVSGDLIKAGQVWEEIMSGYPNNPSAAEGYAYSMMQSRNYTKVINQLEIWHENKNGTYRTHHLLGDAYAAVGRADDARREYEYALQLIRS